MLKKLKVWWQNRRKLKPTQDMLQETRALDYEEEALKKLKRINELRAEVYSAASKAARKGATLPQEGDTPEAKKINSPYVFRDAKGRARLKHL